MKPICDGCGKAADHGQLWAGLQLRRDEAVQGHYQCVIDLVGPEIMLKAIQRGMIANIDPGILIDGKLPKFTTPRASAFDEPLLPNA